MTQTVFEIHLLLCDMLFYFVQELYATLAILQNCNSLKISQIVLNMTILVIIYGREMSLLRKLKIHLRQFVL